MATPTLLLILSALGGSLTAEALNRTDPVMDVYRRETPVLRQQYLSLPMYVDSDLPLVQKEFFSPARGTGQEPLPSPVRELLLPVRPDASPTGASAVTVRTSCQRNRMQLQVDRNILGVGEPLSHLKLGTCRVSKSTEDHVFFEYDFRLCGTRRAMIHNQIVYFNLLHYDPPDPSGPIRRTAPLSLPVACYFNRFVYSYKIGYTPKVQMRKVLKKMKNAANFVLTPRNAQWKEVSQSDHYVLGEPMFFQAEVESLSNDGRLYVHTCYVTPEKSHASKPQYPVIRNFGCLVDSSSKFIPHKNNAVRFSVHAFLFKGMTNQQLYMHCTMSVGGLDPTPTAKSCNYDSKAKRWAELFGSNSACDCCDSSCSSDEAEETRLISSSSWTINLKTKPVPQLKKRKTASTTTTTSATQTASTEETQWRWKSLPEESADFLMREATSELPRATWVEEKQVKGSAVVEEEEVAVKPRTVFEDIFDFDK